MIKHPILFALIVLVFSASFVSAQRQVAEKYKKIGTDLAKAGEFDEAIKNLTKAIEVDPEYAEAYNNRGNVNLKQEKYTEALKDFNRAIELKGDDPAFYTNRAVARTKAGDPAGAIQDYTEAITLSPEDATLFQKRGLLKYENKDFAGAVSDMDKAILKDDKNEDFLYFRALVKLSSPEYNDGHLDMFRAAEMGHMKAKMTIVDVFFDNIPKDEILASEAKSSMMFYLKDFNGAIAEFDKLIKLSPKNGQAYLHRGLAKIHSGNKEGGCADLQKADKLGIKEAASHIGAYCK